MSRVARRRLALDWLDLGPALVTRPGFEASPPRVGPASDGEVAAVDAASAQRNGLGVLAPVPEADGPAPAFTAEDATPGPDEGPLAMSPVTEGRAPVPAREDRRLAPEEGEPAADAEGAWIRLRHQVEVCTDCGLATTRRQTVFGAGARTARLMVIGEAPGAEEDARGEPFVGQAGRLLDLMLAEIGLERGADVFICNVLKCRPPGNRNPAPDEVAACAGFLERQIQQVRPRAVLLLGSFAIRSILQSEASVGSQRGKVHRRTIGGVELPIIVSYHPAYLLRNPADKRKSWEDLLRLSDTLTQVSAPA